MLVGKCELWWEDEDAADDGAGIQLTIMTAADVVNDDDHEEEEDDDRLPLDRFPGRCQSCKDRCWDPRGPHFFRVGLWHLLHRPMLGLAFQLLHLVSCLGTSGDSFCGRD